MTTPYPPAVPAVYRTSGWAIAGFVCSFFFGLLGLIFSVIGYNECKRSGGTLRGEGLALAGIIISSVTLALTVLGIAAAIAIPAFMDYTSRTRRSEPDPELMRLEKALTQYAIMNNELPRASAPLTPADSCCAGSGHRCFDVQSWQIPAWQQLDFSIDKPHQFQYSYESNGQTFTGRAVGDLDCDGSTVTYELRGVISGSGITTFSKRGPIGRD